MANKHTADVSITADNAAVIQTTGKFLKTVHFHFCFLFLFSAFVCQNSMIFILVQSK